MNIDILGSSGLKWTGMGEFNSNDHCIYYCGQECLRRNGVTLTVNKKHLTLYLMAETGDQQDPINSRNKTGVHFCHFYSVFFWRFSLGQLGFPCGSDGKESACNSGDLCSIPELGRSPGEGKGYPLQYSGLENSMECIVHGFAKSQTQLTFTLTNPRSLQSCPTLCNPIDVSPPGSSIPGNLQARTLEWVAISYSNA